MYEGDIYKGFCDFEKRDCLIGSLGLQLLFIHKTVAAAVNSC
jgi:hypothetical protein